LLNGTVMMFNITMGNKAAQPARDDLNQLWVLAALGKTRRVEHAAQLLGMTQPGVSNALRRLRQRFGDPLLVRTPQGMEATPRGQQLIDTAKMLVDEYQARVVAASPFDPATSATEFRLALSDVGEMAFLPAILEYLRVHAPRTCVRSVNLRPRALAEALEGGEVDLAIGYFPDLKGGGYFQQRLFSSGFTCLVRADHPKVGDTLTRADFLTLRHAAVEATGRSQEVLEEYLRKLGIERRIALHVPHFMSIPVVIAQSDLVATVPRAVGSAFVRLSPLRLVKPPFALPRFALKQHWHRRFHKDARSMWLRTLIMTLFNRN
jgi:DNA-binding transcriptional LysR family regulator